MVPSPRVELQRIAHRLLHIDSDATTSTQHQHEVKSDALSVWQGTIIDWFYLFAQTSQPRRHSKPDRATALTALLEDTDVALRQLGVQALQRGSRNNNEAVMKTHKRHRTTFLSR
jgi:hypothetical protein